MENTLQVFKSTEFGEFRTVVINNEPWFVGKDVASILGYADTFGALKKHVDLEDKQNCQNDSFESPRGLTVINESGLYSLVLSSRLPTAKKFKRWVTSEVLPSIRKTGGYHLPNFANPAEAARAWADQFDARQRAEKQIEQDKPKVLFADSVSVSHTSILIGELAKLLQQNGVPMGQNRLFQWLREKSYLIRRKGTDYNMPTQRAMEMGLFEVKETVVSHSDGHTSISKTPKVTGKGQIYFINKFLESAKLAKAGGER
ncbi:phage antirepressor [Megasphaera butyrica]|uniref:phage antirepressor n=1 Tax=Megasphaera butyrica TaxID=2981791 RepID=UPI000822CFF8|nr:phage antirepressor [Megasphaera butyrica]MCU6714951.1 phage antirepressor [Megasphaera butyrica]SCH85062.1 Uncharacterized phage-encoded protein [uncultured Megasphaera sp.]SCJ43192.1 Uncharacterized phage-encoded protein [uncultured Ruminococcus sp.]